MLTARSRLAFLENELIHEFYKQREHIYDMIRSSNIPFLAAVVIFFYRHPLNPWSCMHTGTLNCHDDEIYMMLEKRGTTREQQMDIF